jgi:hypothetical protein
MTSPPTCWPARCAASTARPWPPTRRRGARSASLAALLLPAVSPQRLFADAFPFPTLAAVDEATECPAAASPHHPQPQLPSELVSAVDVYHRGAPLLSRVVETSTSSSWFLTSPFCVDAVEHNKTPTTAPALLLPAETELSWVVIDPRGGRAMNVSSRRPVAVDRHWYTGDTLVRYAVVLGGCKFEATVTCAEDTGHVRELGLSVQDADGAAVSGEGALRILAAALAGPRKGGEEEAVVAKGRYEEFVRSKRGRKESKARKEVFIDLCCSAVSAVAVLSFIAAVVLRYIGDLSMYVESFASLRIRILEFFPFG